MKFNCPHCQYLLKVPDNAAGRTGTCPKCHNKVRVPGNTGATGRAAPGPRADRPAPGAVRCPLCSELNPPGAMTCRVCGESLNGSSGDYRPARPARRSRGASLPTPPSLPAKKSGFGQFVKMGCFFVAFMFVVLTIIGMFVGRSTTGRQSRMANGTVDDRRAELRRRADGGDIDALRSLAEAGDAEAQYALGARYAAGAGVEMNEFEELRWTTMAAIQGHPKAQYILGLKRVQDGDIFGAREWFQKAAKQGDSDAAEALREHCSLF